MKVVRSVQGTPIRLTVERWSHIVTEHAELTDMQPTVLETIANPQRVLEGGVGELLALHEVELGKWLVVVYREGKEDGFIITAFYASHTFLRETESRMVTLDVGEYLRVLPAVKRTPQQTIWLTYDQEADVLYVNFKQPSHATDSELTDDDVIVRYEDNEIIGLTVLHVSQRTLN